MNDTTPAATSGLIDVTRSHDRGHAVTSDTLAGALVLGPSATPYQLAVMAYARASHLKSVCDILDRDAPAVEVFDAIEPLIQDVQMITAALEKVLRPTRANGGAQ